MGNQQTEDDAPRASKLAYASLISGILGMMCILPLVGSIAAIVLGHLARGRIARSQGQLAGDAVAVAGLAMGYLGLAALAVLVVAMGLAPLFRSQRSPNLSAKDARNLKQIGLACLMFSGDNGGNFPSDFCVLTQDDYISVGGVWQSPLWKAVTLSELGLDPCAGLTDYEYVGAGLREDDPNATIRIVAHTKPQPLSDTPWINFLFVDGHAEGRDGTDPRAIAKAEGWLYGAEGLDPPPEAPPDEVAPEAIAPGPEGEHRGPD